MNLRAITVIVAIATGLVIAPISQVYANLAGERWGSPTVCVEDHTNPSNWPTRTAVQRWDAVPDLRFVYRNWPDYTCRNYTQRVVITAEAMGDNGWAARTWTWVHAGTDRLHHVRIVMNNTYRNTKNWDDRRSAIMHELGHASGLAHTNHWTSLMNVNSWRQWNYPTTYDKQEVERRYPW